MSDCLFCKIVARELPCYKVWEDENHFAFLDINPIREGHTLVVPKQHASYLFGLDDASYQSILSASKTVSQRLKEVFQVPRIGVVVEGFSVDHVHIHLIPITDVGQLDPKQAKPGNPLELTQIAEQIKNH
ncbi:HIT family protein [Candidatus Uhrbacteria bacterium]|nr:HIT family protein [Candidatus Uhrbacteria bacterium]